MEMCRGLGTNAAQNPLANHTILRALIPPFKTKVYPFEQSKSPRRETFDWDAFALFHRLANSTAGTEYQLW